MEKELKDAIEASTKLQKDLHSALEKTEQQQQQQGRVSADLQEKVAKIETALDAKVEEAQKRYDELERRLNRGELFGGAGDKAEAMELELQAFNKSLAHKEGGASKPLDMESYQKRYKPAFWAFVRGKEQAVDRLGPDFRAALTVGSDPSGGYQAPADVTNRVVELVYESSPIRKYAEVRRTSRDRIEIRRDVDQAVLGGWVGEVASRAATNTPQTPVPHEIPLHEQYAFPLISQKELDTADQDLEAWLVKKLGQRFLRDENTGFVTGNGIMKPRGFTTYASGTPTKAAYERIQQVKSGQSGAFAAAPNGPDLFVDLMGAMKEEYLEGSIWAMTRTTLSVARKLKDSYGEYQVQLNPGLQGRPGFEILGFPVARFADMAELGAGSLSVAFANFGEGYLIGDHVSGLRILRDPYTQKPHVGIYAQKMVGGDVANFEAIKLGVFSA